MNSLGLVRITVWFAVLSAFVTHNVSAQSARATSAILTRTLMVRSQFGSGTIFSIDVDQREYWITAKHILTGAKHPPFGTVPNNSISLSILSPDASEIKWIPEAFSVIDAGKDIDIVVLAPSTPLASDAGESVPADVAGVPIGGECEFLGYPGVVNGAWKAKWDNGKSFYLPFIKRCTISGRFEEPLRFWVLDGINNEGFSGGPVVFETGSAQRIMAVLSGYRPEAADVISVPTTGQGPESSSNGNASATPQQVAVAQQVAVVNSGFIIAFDIQYAIDAIKKNPIGPLLPKK